MDRRTNDERLNELEKKIEELLKAQMDCTEAVQNLTETTRGVVEVYDNLNGAIVIGRKVQTFGLWLLKWPAIGYGIYHLGKQIGLWMGKV